MVASHVPEAAMRLYIKRNNLFLKSSSDCMFLSPLLDCLCSSLFLASACIFFFLLMLLHVSLPGAGLKTCRRTTDLRGERFKGTCQILGGGRSSHLISQVTAQTPEYCMLTAYWPLLDKFKSDLRVKRKNVWKVRQYSERAPQQMIYSVILISSFHLWLICKLWGV